MREARPSHVRFELRAGSLQAWNVRNGTFIPGPEIGRYPPLGACSWGFRRNDPRTEKPKNCGCIGASIYHLGVNGSPFTHARVHREVLVLLRAV